MIYGGLPQIVSFQSERQKADYLKNIFANVYLKDVIERNKIQNVDEIGIPVDVLASAIGAPINPSKIANTFASERQMTKPSPSILTMEVNRVAYSVSLSSLTCFL